MIKALIIALLAFSASCSAVETPKQEPIIETDSVEFCWTAVTVNTDDQPIVVDHYMIFHGLRSDPGEATAVNAGPGPCFTLLDQPRGSYHAWGWPVDADGLQGELSNEHRYTIGQFRPRATEIE